MKIERVAMDSLMPGDAARVEAIGLEGAMRRRLQDLGLVEGTRVLCRQRAPAGDPVAYLVRGTVIALRKEDACRIYVVPEKADTPGERPVRKEARSL